MTRRLCYALDLVDDAATIAEYRRWHAPGGPPAGVLERLLERGVAAMQIWLTGNRLFMIMDVTDALTAASSNDSDHPEDRAWEARMDAFQQPLPWADGAKWVAMEPIFELYSKP